jgi:hypothetical protein
MWLLEAQDHAWPQTNRRHVTAEPVAVLCKPLVLRHSCTCTCGAEGARLGRRILMVMHVPVRGRPSQRSPKGRTTALLTPKRMQNRATFITPKEYEVHQQQCLEKPIPISPACPHAEKALALHFNHAWYTLPRAQNPVFCLESQL